MKGRRQAWRQGSVPELLLSPRWWLGGMDRGQTASRHLGPHGSNRKEDRRLQNGTSPQHSGQG